MTFGLTVIHPFGDYRRGDQITDPGEVQEVLGGENAHHCNRVALQSAPAAQAAAASAQQQ